ncbi:iron-containing alcohol dehydrogenase [Clostridium sp. E02]|uniref:iron-containing alcohol dehydrogenase n=1 Tax=Clostridium sp. E02 TaxID=2487134 RepID=UPI000F51BD02|nr:iron-containing alcohol dehydrogenase [Clostridium sp. E02]
MGREFIMPRNIISGQNALETAKGHLKSLGTKALIVTDEMMVKLGNTEVLLNVLKEQNIDGSVFSGINGEPTDAMILEGLDQYVAERCDFLIALGGGSPIDSMKAIAAMRANEGSISDYMGKKINGNLPAMAAIPTTAGTGSEATQFTIITDTKKDVKMLLSGTVLMPDLAIIDPQFTVTAPKKITAATGLDALTHAMEAYTSRKAQPLSDVFALSAVKRIFTWLPKAYHDGADLKAREEMSLAALEAGIAFNNASVTLVHGMSRPIGALFHVPHGISNAMLLKECFRFALDGAYDRFAVMAREIKVADEDTGNEEASHAFLSAVIDLLKELEIPTLSQYGIDQDEFLSVIEKMAADAMASGSPLNTRKEMDQEDVKEIYRRLFD